MASADVSTGPDFALPVKNLVQIRRHATAGGPALFVDRDGVLIFDTGYPRSASEVQLLNGVGRLARLQSAGVSLICVTNQSGVGRNYLSWSQFIEVQERMDELLAAEGVHLDAVFACGVLPADATEAGTWRKPEPGMLFAARDLLGIDLPRSVMIGDKPSDLQAAANAGLKAGAMLSTDDSLLPAGFPSRAFESLTPALDYLMAELGCAATGAEVSTRR